MKKCTLLPAFLLFSLVALAQKEPYCKILFDSLKYPEIVRIDSERMFQRTPIYMKDNDKMLVSCYTWKTICKGDFSTLTGVDNSAAVGKYAALNINQTNSTFTFTPLIINPSVLYSKFKFIQSVDFSGTVDKANILDLKNWRTVSLGYSVTWIFSQNYRFDNSQRGTQGHKPRYDDYKQIYDELELQFMLNYFGTNDSGLAKLNHPEFNDTKSLHQAWLDSIARYEKLMTKNSWTSKSFGWLKATATPLSFDNANYIVTGDTATYNSPLSKAYYTPGLMLSANYYWGLHSGWNFYVSAFVQGVLKDTFTDVFSATEWDKNQRLTDSTLLKKDTKNVYLATDRNIKTKVRPNFGLEGIVLFPASGYIGAGLDLSGSYNGLISNQAGRSTGWLQTIQAGLIVSFKDKTGGSTINVEPYYQDKRYRDYALPSVHLWGVKLSIPFTRLY